MMLKLLLTMFALYIFSGCSATIKDYSGSQPNFDLKEFFSGDLEAWGMFQDRSGKVVRRFKVLMKGTWQGNDGVLEEWFTYDDGEKQTRTWYLKKLPNQQYTGTAADIVGTAYGETQGYALQWHYTLSLPVDDTVYDVYLDDWMFLIDEGSVLNRSEVTKFGFKVGEVTLFIKRK